MSSMDVIMDDEEEGYDCDEEYEEIVDGQELQNFVVGEESAISRGRDVIVAARNGDVPTLKLILLPGRAPNVSDWLGLTALHHAAAQGHLESVQMLIQYGSVKDLKSKVGKSALHMACQEGHAHVALYLVAQGALIDLKDMFLMTPLHWAVERGHEEATCVLLQNGANHTTRDKFNRTSLQIAADNGHSTILALLQKGNFLGLQSLSSPLGTQLLQQKIDRSVAGGGVAVVREASGLESRAGRLRIPDGGGPRNQTRPAQPPRKYRIVCNANLPQKRHRFLLPRQRFTFTTKVPLEREPFQEIEDGEGEDQSVEQLPEMTQMRFDSRMTMETQESEAWRVLEAHGIEMLEGEDASLVAAALGGGHKVVLTEAGRQALVMTEVAGDEPPPTPPSPPPLQSQPQSGSLKPTNIDTKVVKRIWKYQQAMRHLERKQQQLELSLRNCISQQNKVKQRYARFSALLVDSSLSSSSLQDLLNSTDSDLDEQPVQRLP